MPHECSIASSVLPESPRARSWSHLCSQTQSPTPPAALITPISSPQHTAVLTSLSLPAAASVPSSSSAVTFSFPVCSSIRDFQCEAFSLSIFIITIRTPCSVIIIMLSFALLAPSSSSLPLAPLAQSSSDKLHVRGVRTHSPGNNIKTPVQTLLELSK
ncbi:hypothetical protein XENOCAPTIV_023025 [Xenoophorus captivus]|uniref:Uncharacterized protein n=1 Tax=Xenoophorus captivus TaxID=1517983 RepID=A0ABV0RA26_9TELE